MTAPSVSRSLHWACFPFDVRTVAVFGLVCVVIIGFVASGDRAEITDDDSAGMLGAAVGHTTGVTCVGIVERAKVDAGVTERVTGWCALL